MRSLLINIRCVVLIAFLDILLWGALAFSATFPGWLIQDTPMAFTMNRGEVELNAQFLLVNDTVDFLDVRQKLTGGSRLFTDDSGDLYGAKLVANVGILPSLMAFYRGQYHELVTELGESHTFGGLDSDRALHTLWHEAGLRWNFLDIPVKRLSFAVEGAWMRHDSDDFSFKFTEVNLGDTILRFERPQSITASDLNDDGWYVRLTGSLAIKDVLLFNLWAGYRWFDASSAVSTTITYRPIKDNFDRHFSIDETQWRIGAGFIWQITPRLPLEFFYEFVNLDRKEHSTGARNTSVLSRYTNPENLSPEDTNHILTGKIGYWITPNLNVNIEGKLMTNQFLGVVPHYNNTITSRFFDKLYGYMGLGVGYAF